MGIFDAAKDALGNNKEGLDQGIDKAAEFANEKTGGQHADQIQQGSDFAKEQAGNFLGNNEGEGEQRPEQPA